MERMECNTTNMFCQMSLNTGCNGICMQPTLATRLCTQSFHALNPPHSQALDLYKALKCFFFEFWELDSEAPPSLDNRTMSTLGRILTPSCVTMPAQSRICMLRVDTGQALVQQVLPLARVWAGRGDVMLANFGLHHGSRDHYAVRSHDCVHALQACVQKQCLYLSTVGVLLCILFCGTCAAVWSFSVAHPMHFVLWYLCSCMVIQCCTALQPCTLRPVCVQRDCCCDGTPPRSTPGKPH